MAKESWLERVWHLITPELVYFAVCYLVELAAGIYLGYSMMDDYIKDMTLDVDGFTEALLAILTEYAVLLQSIAALAAIFFLVRMYFNDYKKRRFVFDKRSLRFKDWLFLIPAGVLASLAGNMLMNLSDLATLSEGFQSSQELLFSGPFIIQLVGIGVILPVCEELIYRGLIYMRMRQYLNVNMAIVVSALLFAIFHGNLVQGIYAFLLGILLAFVYEKYGSLKAPALLHISANMLSLALVYFQPTFDGRGALLLIGSAAVILCLAVVWLMDRQVSVEKIYFENGQRTTANGNSPS